MREAVIVDAIRTPIGRLGGALSTVRPDDLAANVLQALVKRNRLDGSMIDDVYMGCANQAGEDNRNIARMALLLAGLPIAVPGVTVNRLCASGLDAVNQASAAIIADRGDVFLAGGVESMSRAPYVLMKPQVIGERGNQTMYDTMLGWRMVNQRMNELYGTASMGETAENVAQRYGISREAQDTFALESQRRTADAIQKERFVEEIIPVPVQQKRGEPTMVDKDEHPRPDTTMEQLAKLKPAFRAGGTVTAGNASGLNDGAAGLLLMEAGKAKELEIRPRARIITSAVAGVHPDVMGIGPVPATQKALQRAGLAIDQIDLVELNEAFASQSLACIAELGLDPARVNVNGGAIALGHPLGCSGARLLTTLLYEMERREARYGLATMCIGVGQGCATIIERL